MRWGYLSLYFETDSPIFHLCKATGLTVTDWHEAIMVNQTGQRFWNELDSSYDFINAALGHHGDDDQAQRRRPDLGDLRRRRRGAAEVEARSRRTSIPDGYFSSADTIFELAGRIKNPYQKQPMSGAVLQETVNRYNSFVTIRRRHRLQQADAAAQDREAAVLCRVGDADPARFADRACAPTPTRR